MRAILAALVALLAIVAPGVAAGPAAADVSDFSFSSMEVDYILGRDADGRSTLTTVETLTAEFPDFDQNRGILRALPEEYEGDPTELDVVSVTDGDGTPREYEAESEDGFLELTIAGDEFVRGTQVYVITYEQQNVTLFPDDSDVEEFFWDVNGTGWAQPFGEVTARLHLEDDLADALTGDSACYVGAEGSTARCGIDSEAMADGALLTASVRDLAPFENLSIAVGFQPGTFTPRDSSLFASPFSVPLLASVALLLAAIAAAVVHLATRLRNAPGRPVLVPEYLPLAEPDLLVSSVLLHKQSRGVAATLVSLAVRGVLRIVEVESGRKPKFALELLSREGRPRLGSGPRGASRAENALIDAVFGRNEQRERVVLDPKDTALSKRIYNATKGRTKDAVAQGYQRKPPTRPWVLLAIAGAVGLTLTALFAILLLDDSRGGWVPALALVLVPFGVLTWILPARSPLTSTGAEVRDHLLGIRDYLRLAEAERFRVLQSPQGATREAAGDVAVVEVYERLLPHAVLFSVEKEWADVLGTHYEQSGEQPDWYTGSTAFHAGAFSAGIAGLSSTTSSSFSGSSSSSSSSGSSGGGSSGGGGGGGGGGGV